MSSSKILHGDCLDLLKTIAPGTCQTCVTSPPYYGLRSYDGIKKTDWPEVKYTLFGFEIVVPEMTCELGHEKDPKEFIGHLVEIFRRVKDTLREDGTLWVNIGDSYASSAKDRTVSQAVKNSTLRGGLGTQVQVLKQHNKITQGLKRKDMIGIPWMLAFALRDDGWYLRSDIIWAKKNVMPESVTDRPTKSHEYIFLLSKSETYYYNADAIRTEPKFPGVKKYAWGRAIDGSIADVRKGNGEKLRKKVQDKQRGHKRRHAGFNERWDQMSKEEQMEKGANKRTVWEIATHPFSEAHFATFPEKLIVDPILAGSPEKSIILDPFLGSGTTGIVATKLGRDFIGIEASAKYVQMAKKRFNKELGMFSPV